MTRSKLAVRQSYPKPDTLKQLRLTGQGRVYYGNYLSSPRVIIVQFFFYLFRYTSWHFKFLIRKFKHRFHFALTNLTSFAGRNIISFHLLSGYRIRRFCICSPKSKTKKERKEMTVIDSIDGRLRVLLYPLNVKRSKKKS